MQPTNVDRSSININTCSILFFTYWKEKETHIHFGCYLYQRCINCITESLFEMLNIHICTHCDTFLCKKTTCVSHVNGKGYRGYKREIPAVLNNRKNWFFKCPGFGLIGINWKLLNVNINMGHKNYIQWKFYVYVSTDATADAAFWSALEAFILTLKKSEPKIWMHIKHCLSRAKSIPVQEAQILYCVDAAASDIENLCRWSLASSVDILWEFLFRIL